jgi:hypothetical protein
MEITVSNSSSLIISRGYYSDREENADLFSFCVLRPLPSNGRYLQKHYLETVLNAILLLFHTLSCFHSYDVICYKIREIGLTVT